MSDPVTAPQSGPGPAGVGELDPLGVAEVPLRGPATPLAAPGPDGPLPGSVIRQEPAERRWAPQMAGEPMSSGVRSGLEDLRPSDRRTGPPIENEVL
jgi:hypothetical protein